MHCQIRLISAENSSIFNAYLFEDIFMEAIYADLSISMSEFKKNPSQILRSAGERPVAVLSHNRPAFYMITPSVYEALIDRNEDRALTDIARQRLALKDSAIEVNIDEI